MKNKIHIVICIFTLSLLIAACKDKEIEKVIQYTPSSLIELKIGTQIWSSNNLDVDQFRNGDEIPEAKTPEEWKTAGEAGKPAWCFYDNDPANGKKYGRLYNWYTVHDPRKLAPSGWHVPTYPEWRTLINYLTNNGFGYQGSGNDIAKSMATTSGWRNSSIAGTVGNDQTSNNRCGFNALPAGTRGGNGTFYVYGSICSLWSSSMVGTWAASIFSVYAESDVVVEQGSDFSVGFSVRCVKD